MKILLIFSVLPLCAAFLIALLGRWFKHWGEILASLTTLALLISSLYCAKLVGIHKILVYKVSGWMPPLGICLVADGLASFMLVTVNLIVFLSLIYAISYMNKYTDKWKFYSLFMIMLAGLNGVIISGDLFNMYVFLEAASISGYCLVAFGTEAQDLEASFKYAIMGSLASVFILLGIVLLYSYVSTLNMADISLELLSKPRGMLVGFVSVLFLTGFCLKSALVPFHAWLPDAHSSAPTPVSAVLSGVFIKAVGIYALARVFLNVIGIYRNLLFILMVLGAASMIIGAFLAIAQKDIKRMFAYSSISQVGYIILALGIGTPLACLGAVFHLFNHAVFKSLLFLNAGAIEYSTGTRDLSRLGGLNNKMPVTSYTSLIGSMSISGVPPFSGFWSKLVIILAACQAGRFGFAFIAAVVSIITLVYYLKFIKFTFLGSSDKTPMPIKDIHFTMKFSMITLAIICIIAGVLLIPSNRQFLQGASDSLLSGRAYADAVFGALK